MEKPGPKCKYAGWMCDCVIEVASTQGQYRSAMLWEIGKRLDPKANRPISPDTFSRWRKDHPEFEEAWQTSQIISQALDEKALSDFATGKIRQGNATAFALLLNNKYREEYRPATESGSINITNNTVNLSDLSKEELSYRINRASETLIKAGQGHLLSPTPKIIDMETSDD